MAAHIRQQEKFSTPSRPEAFKKSHKAYLKIPPAVPRNKTAVKKREIILPVLQ